MKTLLFGGIVAVAAISNSASAGLTVGDTITLSRSGGEGYQVYWTYDSTATYNASLAGSSSVGLAQFMTFAGVSGSGVQAFCLEVAEHFPDDPITYDVKTLDQVPEESPPGALSSVAITLIEDLYAKWYDTVVTNAPSSYGDRNAGYSAFQMVIWEISHENFGTTDASVAVSRMDLQAGAFGINSSQNQTAVFAMANQMIASLGNGGFQSFGDRLVGLSNPTNQDLLVVVPSPAIAGLAGLGLAGMRRRRR